jgi:8-oxo-dGTP diphosphatase
MIKVAILWLINEDDEVLLAQRAHHKAQDPGAWGPSAAGKLERDETFDDALAREVREELALTAADYTPRFIFEKDYAHPDGEARKFGVYCAEFPKARAGLIRIEPNEVAGIKWLGVSELIKKMKSPPNELVPSVHSIWLDTFQAIWPETNRLSPGGTRAQPSSPPTTPGISLIQCAPPTRAG